MPYNGADELSSSNKCSLYANVYLTQIDTPPSKPPTYDDTVTPNVPKINAKFIMPNVEDDNKKLEFFENATVSILHNLLVSEHILLLYTFF